MQVDTVNRYHLPATFHGDILTMLSLQPCDGDEHSPSTQSVITSRSVCGKHFYLHLQVHLASLDLGALFTAQGQTVLCLVWLLYLFSDFILYFPPRKSKYFFSPPCLFSAVCFFLFLCSFCPFLSLHFLLCLFFFLGPSASHLSLLFLCHPLLCWKWRECQCVHSSRTANTSFPGEGNLLYFDLWIHLSVLSAGLFGVWPF